MNIDLNNKRAFVTAGGNGIGRETVIAMHDIGARVFTCDIDKSALSTLPEGIETFDCDVSNADELNHIFDQLLPGGLDILVNNAGVSGPTKAIEDVTNEEWNHCMSVCIDAQFYCARRVVPVFKKQQSGVIINLISGAGILGFPNRGPYVAAKWAVTGFTKTLAMELGPENIRVNGIVPGNVKGDRMERVIHAHAEAEGIDPSEVRRLYSKGTSMQCYVDPKEIAGTICFLASNYGRHISGQILGIDGNTETLYPRT